jgi:hypothetical protein
MEVLIGKLADQYLLDNVLAAERGARASQRASYILREEIGAACFNAHAHILLGRTKFWQPATAWRTGGAETRMSGSIELGHRELLALKR